jgi:hypothetical protein
LPGRAGNKEKENGWNVDEFYRERRHGAESGIPDGLRGGVCISGTGGVLSDD